MFPIAPPWPEADVSLQPHLITIPCLNFIVVFLTHIPASNIDLY